VNSAGNAIIKVDNTTFVPYNEKRNAVMITSNDQYDFGTLWVFDALHVPYGCSAWGAYWSRGAGVNWPAGGEIDIFEGINLATRNQMSLHTTAGCTQPQGVTQTGTQGNTNCDYSQNGNAGCIVQDSNTASYGAAFAQAGGGVWVTEFAETGINIWFFNRPSIPAALSTNSVDTSALGTPSASYPASSCNPTTHFTKQQIVIDLKLCGVWAGNPSTLQESCPALQTNQTCYTTYVINNNSNYNQAYYEIKSLKIFATSKDKVISGPTSTGTATATGPKSASTGGSGSVTRIGTFSSVQGWAGAVIGAVTGLFALLG